MSRPRPHLPPDTIPDSQCTAPGSLPNQHTMVPSQSHRYNDTGNDGTALHNPHSDSRSSIHRARDIEHSLISERRLDEPDAIGSELLSPPGSVRQQFSASSTLPVLKHVKGPVLRLDVLPTNLQPGPESAISPSVAGPRHPTPSISLPTQERAHHLQKPKKRREKPRIELAPDQPPTTQGKPRARVYVACVQCRTRKIRCDGAKPVCHNCARRTTSDNECNYDTVPKRRGPDKTPGARQRMARDVRDQLAGSLLVGRRRRHTRTTPPPGSNTAGHYGSSSLSPSSSSPETTIVLPIPLTILPSVDTGSLEAYNTCSPVATNIPPSYTCPCHGLSPCPGLLDTTGLTDEHGVNRMFSRFSPENSLPGMSVMPCGTHPGASHSYIIELDENGNERQDGRPDMVNQPPLSFARDMWWDSLLYLYMSPNSKRLHSLSPSQRESAAQGIASDLRFVFKASNYWFSFFHIPTFFGNFFDPIRRKQMQPSLVLALLAMSTFWQSSEVGIGSPGRERALRFREEAQGALEASVNAGWLDETLAQAAWLLALFEVCAHPRHSSERCVSSLVMLDSIIRSLSLTLVDADDPNTTMFLPGTVPAVTVRDQHRTSWFGYQPLIDTCQTTQGIDVLYTSDSSSPRQHAPEIGCSCKSLTLGTHWPSTHEHAPMWGQTPAWNDSWSANDIRKESIRRLCWSAMITAAGHISYTTAHRSHNPDLFIADPANYAILFSGESISGSPALSTSSKNTVWALQDRCFLLWHACVRMRTDRSVSDAEKAQFATRAWLEADALDAALNKHTCAIERAFIYQAREYIFNTRMSISYEFQRYIPLVTTNMNGSFHRHKAEEWLRHQAVVAERFMHGLHTITGNANNLLARRPFFVFWFMGQISRSLSLWECDNTLTVALDVCKALLPAIDYLSALWPCPEQRTRYNRLRERLINSCYAAGVCLPPPPNFSLPSPSSPETLV